ncbi:replication initiator protein [Pontibacter ummariensis]|uniref:Initiator Replication protein n=1 Tax=Pontibacter ummariensis TaxID=1610492 RepID=A0A239IWV8_9BACT|nr:replication initiation protein [Pontibacter ummariensis]PRY09009.1 replication initiator protein [Pontibacter ummariensis]SNS98246.1 Initiator Replication protein [Pontibacter ummariensis]
MKRLKKVDNILTVAQHNNLVRSDLAFTHLEAKVFTKLLETIPKDAQKLGEVNIKISDVIGTGGSGKMYKLLHEAVKSLDKRRINLLKVDAGPYDYDSCGLFDNMEMKVGQNLIRGEWGRKIQPYLIQLKKGFTLGELEILLKLKSGHSYKLYWLLRSYESLTRYEDSIDNLKTILVKQEEGKPDKYTQWNDFKRYVLEPAVAEVKEVSAEAGNPLTFNMELLKSGKKVIGVRFTDIKSANSRKKISEGAQLSPAESGKLLPKYEGKKETAYNRLTLTYGLSPEQASEVVDKVPQEELWPVMKQLNLDIVTNKLHERRQPPVTAGAWSMTLLKKHFGHLLKWAAKESSEQGKLAL